jgi:hypothetical protein
MNSSFIHSGIKQTTAKKGEVQSENQGQRAASLSVVKESNRPQMLCALRNCSDELQAVE